MSELRAGQWPAANGKDAGRAILPPEHPMAMPVQDLRARLPRLLPSERGSGQWAPVAALFGGALLLTGAFARELYAVLSFVQITPIQVMFLILATLSFAWIALGSLSAATGFLRLYAGDNPDSLALPEPGPLTGRTALLFPIYHEDCASIAAAVQAMAEDLAATGQAHAFDVFILSDSRTEAAGLEEEHAFSALADRLRPVISVYYRRRRENVARKSGNIRDWIERFGGAYASFVVLDADSLMAGETLVRLARAMQINPRAGLIQTVPRLVGGRTIFQQLQQFAAGVYGPAAAAGLATWQGGSGNYWGHNAIIRTQAFAAAAGLPELQGRRPFGGHILSHDFVEAALLQRAGWEVHMVPSAPGSYEGAPPSLVDLAVRDRRWAQGNLQHLAIVGAPTLSTMGRVHLAMGAAAYIVSAIWAASLAVGLVLALQGQHVIPSYFHDSKSLFPIWPVIDPGAAFRLFLVTMGVVLMPKALGLVLEILRAQRCGERWPHLRIGAAVLVETVLSVLMAPVLMVTQTTAVMQILAGLDSGWRPQRREGSLPLTQAVRFHAWHITIGVALAALTYAVSLSLMAWMSAIMLGLLLSALLSWWTAQPAGRILSYLLSTEYERDPPAILVRARTRLKDRAREQPSEPPRGAPSLPQAA
jgi:membrane glycosyltransferase